MRFWTGKRLHYRQQAVKPCAGNPSLTLNELVSDHGDLRDRPAECQDAEVQKFQEQGDER